MNSESKYINIRKFMQPEYKRTFILSEPGVGKTTSALVESIEHCYKHNQMFIYLERHQVQADSFGINLSLISKLSGYDIKYKLIKDKDTGKKIRVITATKNNETKDVGYIMALSTALDFKSINYNNTWLVVYDDFINTSKTELKNESNLFSNFTDMVFKHYNDYKILFLSSTPYLFNRYFIEYNIIPSGKITKNKETSAKVVIYQTSKSLSTRNNTALYRMYKTVLESDPRMENNKKATIFDNKFFVESGFLEKPNKKSVLECIYKLEDQYYCFWKNGNYFIISNEIKPSIEQKMLSNELPIKREFTNHTLSLHKMFSDGQLYFSNEQTRDDWLKYFKNYNFI